MIDVKTLALYLGSEVKAKDNDGLDIIFTVDLEFLNDFDNQCYKEVKLLLRQMPSMTESEWQEMFKLPGMSLGATNKESWLNQFDQFEQRPKPGLGKKWQQQNPTLTAPTESSRIVKGLSWEYYTYSPSAFQWLLSKGFDLFGLIEKGDAVFFIID